MSLNCNESALSANSTMSNNTNPKAKSLGAARGGTRKSGQRSNMKVARRELRDDHIMRRITVPSLSISSSAGGVIAIGNLSTDLLRSAGTEFANYSARYGQFRVHRMRAVFKAARRVNTDGGTDDLLSTLYVVGQKGDVNPSAAANLLSHPHCQIHSTGDDFEVSVNWKDYLDTHLFGSVNSAIPADQVMAIFRASSTNAILVNSVVYYTVSLIGDVEFSQPI